MDYVTGVPLHGFFVSSTCFARTTGLLIISYKVYFALDSERRNLRIRAKPAGSEETLELIPHKILINDLPTILVEDYAHWLNLATGEIQFRPLERQWDPTSVEWRLQLCSVSRATVRPAVMTIAAGGSELVDINSGTFKVVASVLAALENHRFLTIVRRYNPPHDSIVDIILPRYRINFFINEKRQLESRNLQNMIIDDNAHIGTMIGLKNRLVLKPKCKHAQTLPRARAVLIPYGEVKVNSSDDLEHVHVRVEPTDPRRRRFFQYHVDEDMGSLSCTTSLESRMYKTYLHAITSHCLPDPLTSQTGTEEALRELSLGSMKSFQSLHPEHVLLLSKIADLTPRRSWYPKFSPSMQNIVWSNDISPLAQHNVFYFSVQSIIKFARQLQMLTSQPGLKDWKDKHEHAVRLLVRAAKRAYPLYPSDAQYDLPDHAGTLSHSMRVASPTRAQDAGSAAHWASKLTCTGWGKTTYSYVALMPILEQ